MRRKRLAQALSVLLCVCMMLAALPLEVLATAGDIFLPEAEQIAKTEQITLADGSLALQNEYIQIALYDGGYTSYVSTIPTALLKESGSVSAACLRIYHLDARPKKLDVCAGKVKKSDVCR